MMSILDLIGFVVARNKTPKTEREVCISVDPRILSANRPALCGAHAAVRADGDGEPARAIPPGLA